MTLYRLAISALFIFSSIAAAQAQTVWVDDQLYLPVRSGAGSQYRIIENAVPSGTPLEVIETSDTGYTRVRTAKGNDGWVSSQYISNTPIAADRLKTVSRQLEQAKTELSSLKGSTERCFQRAGYAKQRRIVTIDPFRRAAARAPAHQEHCLKLD